MKYKNKNNDDDDDGGDDNVGNINGVNDDEDDGGGDDDVEDGNDDGNNSNNDDINIDIDDDDSIIQTGTHHIAYFLVHSRANSLYFSRSVLYILAISGTRGSSGFGSQSREQIDNKTVT